MENKNTTITLKILLILSLIAVLGGSVTAFPHGYVVDNLEDSFWFSESVKSLTIAGEQRQCTELPVESHTINLPTKGFTIQMQCEDEPALINLYYVNDKGNWDFGKGGEFESPATFKTTEAGMWGWECYTCQAEKECTSNAVGYACKTMTSKQSCISNKFYGYAIECDDGEYCDNGYCIDPLDIEPDWICHDWGECTADSKGKLYQTRICYDARATGSTEGMPILVKTCSTEDYKEDSADDDESDEEETVTVPGGSVTSPSDTDLETSYSFKWGWVGALAIIGLIAGTIWLGGLSVGLIFAIVGALLGLIINLIMWIAW